eukprot:gnl/TRDRNA2_/TRDRNA2_132810_c0_seq1.p1 gnl/TRDRNA2_/TRDRNA2_132810_c0~~gnl/TRDRNA2_/TRDRNA2_132810_c0_seq1.p1  ORF type:complete len:397 (-),score=71.22 gnl/TRDRNA2_/TRDRNA2_132810_c0_seq1:36-1091(-)
MPAAVGTAGCKALALFVTDKVIAKKPDLLIIEAAVNDGDELLENTPNADVAGVVRAAEGIVRTVQRKLPNTAILFLEMFLRDDSDTTRTLKTGSEAWRDTNTQDSVGWYHDVGPRLHRHICRHYGLAQIDLIPAMRSLPLATRKEWFRDDCHHSELGGEKLGNLVAKLLLWAVRQHQQAQQVDLSPPLDAQCWCNGKTMKIGAGWCQPTATTWTEKDSLKLGEQAEWLLLGPRARVTIPFKGRACGLLTMLGPDAPTVKVSVDGGAAKSILLLDHWCYYWRDAVVLLCEGLADTTHMLDVEVDAEPPSHSILKRQPTGPLWETMVRTARSKNLPGPQQLWLLYACAVEGDK